MADSRRRSRSRRGIPMPAGDRLAAPSVVAELEITAIAAGGSGVGRHEGMVVFVPRTAPGDRIRAELAPKGRFAQGTMLELLEASPVRVTPPCEHYVRDRCGGCQLQHLSPEAQLEAKGGIVRDAITRIGKRQVESPPVSPSPRPWRYRNKLTLAMRRRGGGWIAGLHPYDAPDAVFALRDCPITSEEVVSLWRSILNASETLPDERSLRGAVRAEAGESSFVLEGGSAWPNATRFFEQVPELGSLWWKPESGRRRLMHSRRESASPAFAQVNPAMAAVLRAHVLERVSSHAPTSVLDAYAGEGELAMELEQRGIATTVIELDPEAASRARARLHSGNVIEARVEDTLGELLPVDLIVFNPPRTGLDERIPSTLERRAALERPRAIVYVSCNPATLARDLARLPSYRIVSLQSFDMFPQTAHVETVCELTLEAA